MKKCACLKSLTLPIKTIPKPTTRNKMYNHVLHSKIGSPLQCSPREILIKSAASCCNNTKMDFLSKGD